MFWAKIFQIKKKNYQEIEGKEIEKELNLELERFKYTNIELDFTIIELLPIDNINNYLENDKYINSKDYKDEHIFAVQFPGGKNLKISPGKIICKKNNYFLYTLGTDRGSSGSPIILIDNSKIIGLHKAGYTKDKNNKINVGIPLNLIINKINLEYKKIKLEYKNCPSSEELRQSLIKFLDLFDYCNVLKELRNIIPNFFNKKLRITFEGPMGVGKSQVLNCIIGEDILPIKEYECTNRGVILKYQDINDFYLYKANLVKKRENGYEECYFIESEERI